jgi:uncharacterized membrane protein YciS (DUF1049 family)
MTNYQLFLSVETIFNIGFIIGFIVASAIGLIIWVSNK